jgi:hypothetical protein
VRLGMEIIFGIFQEFYSPDSNFSDSLTCNFCNLIVGEVGEIWDEINFEILPLPSPY